MKIVTVVNQLDAYNRRVRTAVSTIVDGRSIHHPSRSINTCSNHKLGRKKCRFNPLNNRMNQAFNDNKRRMLGATLFIWLERLLLDLRSSNPPPKKDEGKKKKVISDKKIHLA